MYPFSGKSYVVSGATAGIGFATARLLSSQGAFVIVIGRSAERCKAAVEQLSTSDTVGQAAAVVADLADQVQVRRAAAEIREMLAARGMGCLDGLVNNAGTFTYSFRPSPDGIEMQWAVNYLAAFLLTSELLALLKAAPLGRVVTVSSDSHYGARIHWDDVELRRRYFGLTAYGQSKLAGILFSRELNRRLGEGSGLRAFAADPGLVKTEIGYKDTPAVVRWVWNLRASAGVTAEYAARGVAYLACEPSIQAHPQVYWKDCQPKKASRAAMDDDSARRLWELSERMVGSGR